MKVHLIRKQTIEKYVQNHAAGKPAFQFWLKALKHADWENPSDILCTFGSADLLGKGSNKIVFDIGGNNYRMICKYHFGATQVHLFICWIGTHAEYDKLCENKLQYTVNKY